MKGNDPAFFEARRHVNDERRPKDVRRQYQRDRARIIHSAAFRRLQGKTQVMGVGEGDFHRTRLTHSIECAQIGAGLLEVIQTGQVPESLDGWMPDRDLIEAACFAHDLGHPPYGHGGEKALYAEMRECGGFEGNAQTLRIISRLEKYQARGRGINPTRRLVLAILKYPIPYGMFDLKITKSSHQSATSKRNAMWSRGRSKAFRTRSATYCWSRMKKVGRRTDRSIVTSWSLLTTLPTRSTTLRI